jgi:hypothetical protein
MSNFNEWQKTKQAVKEAVNWVGNRVKVDSQDGKHYIKVKVQRIKLEYCGQSYAGANNYHEAPTSFQGYLAMAINEMREEIEDRALELLSEENASRAVKAKSEVDAMLIEINEAAQ